MDQIAGRRSSEQYGQSAYYGDDQFSMSRVHLLKSRLEFDLGERIGKRPVVLREFYVYAGAYTSPRIYGGPTYVPAPPGMGVGGAVLAGILGGLTVGGIESARAARVVRSTIRIEIDGKRLEAIASKNVSMGEVDAALGGIVLESIDGIVAQVREFFDGSAGQAGSAAPLEVRK